MKVVVFIDVQKDFVDGALRNEKAIEIMPKIVEFAKECVKNGHKVYATRDTHEKTRYAGDDAIGGYLATLEGRKLPVEHCVEGTKGWEIDERLMEVIAGKCVFVNKRTFGSFGLAEIIEEDSRKTWEKIPYEKNYDIDEIVIAGFCTDICCISCGLLLRAKFPNIKITIMKELCAGTSKENHEAALKVMQSCQIDIK